MATTFGMLNTAFASQFQANWPVEHGVAPSDTAVAIALAMPSVERSGARSMRGGLRAAGLGTMYHAATLRWGDSDVHAGCADMAFYSATEYQRKPGVAPSNKQNHLEGLRAAGLIEKYRVNGVWFTALTDAGVAQVKAVNSELGKLAKGYTVAARDKALKAAEKASKAASKPTKARKPKPVKGDTPVTVEATSDAATGFEPVPVETGHIDQLSTD